MTDCERRAMRALRIIAFAEVRGVCAMPGPHEGPAEMHHIGGRDNACKYVPELAIKLCEHHHKYKQFAPHVNNKLFLFWLEFNWPKKHAMYLKLRYARVHKRDMDMKKICEELEAQADKVLYRVA